MDSRLTPANTHVAHSSLRGLVKAKTFVDGNWRCVAVGVADILKTPNGARSRQALYGERLLVLDDRDGFAFVQAEKDGYVGYVASSALMDDTAATHWVCNLGSHLYAAPDFKQRELDVLSFGAQVAVKETGERFAQTTAGHFIPKAHLAPIDERQSDTVATAEKFLGTPYLWGGNSRLGIDCSGLVQAALIAAGQPCPGDSDMQEAIGTAIPDDTPLQRGDLLFWKGHVALVVDKTQMIHANAYHMAVAYEDIDQGIARIEAQGDGPVTARRRV